MVMGTVLEWVISLLIKRTCWRFRICSPDHVIKFMGTSVRRFLFWLPNSALLWDLASLGLKGLGLDLILSPNLMVERSRVSGNEPDTQELDCQEQDGLLMRLKINLAENQPGRGRGSARMKINWVKEIN